MAKPLIDQAVDRFLGWKLPDDFSPDGGISFSPYFNEGTPYQMRHTSSGTNLLSGIQAKAMLEHVAAPLLERIATLEEAIRTLDATDTAHRHTGLGDPAKAYSDLINLVL